MSQAFSLIATEYYRWENRGPESLSRLSKFILPVMFSVVILVWVFIFTFDSYVLSHVAWLTEWEKNENVILFYLNIIKYQIYFFCKLSISALSYIIILWHSGKTITF